MCKNKKILVRLERVALRKSSSADVAHVRPFAGVNTDVAAKLELKKKKIPNLKLKSCTFSHKDEIFRDGLTVGLSFYRVYDLPVKW